MIEEVMKRKEREKKKTRFGETWKRIKNKNGRISDENEETG